MKSKTLLLICLICLGWTAMVMADDIYVSGVTKITMRTGPGTDHKIVAMLASGTRLEVLNYQTDWSQVKTEDEKTGWVLSRFLTKDKPLNLMVQQLEEENGKLSKALETAESRASELKEKYDALAGIEQKYKQLEQASADYLKLESTYKALQETARTQQEQIQSLEGKVDNEELYWALAGAGVFIIGLVIGLATRQKRRHSLLS